MRMLLRLSSYCSSSATCINTLVQQTKRPSHPRFGRYDQVKPNDRYIIVAKSTEILHICFYAAVLVPEQGERRVHRFVSDPAHSELKRRKEDIGRLYREESIRSAS